MVCSNLYYFYKFHIIIILIIIIIIMMMMIINNIIIITIFISSCIPKFYDIKIIKKTLTSFLLKKSFKNFS